MAIHMILTVAVKQMALQINNVYGVGPLVLTLMAKIHGIIL